MDMSGKTGDAAFDLSDTGADPSQRREAMILPDSADTAARDGLAVLYENGTEAPEITVTECAAGVFTVRADGAPVAVVASATRPEPVEIRVIERNADGTTPRLPHPGLLRLN